MFSCRGGYRVDLSVGLTADLEKSNMTRDALIVLLLTPAFLLVFCRRCSEQWSKHSLDYLEHHSETFGKSKTNLNKDRNS